MYRSFTKFPRDCRSSGVARVPGRFRKLIVLVIDHAKIIESRLLLDADASPLSSPVSSSSLLMRYLLSVSGISACSPLLTWVRLGGSTKKRGRVQACFFLALPARPARGTWWRGRDDRGAWTAAYRRPELHGYPQIWLLVYCTPWNCSSGRLNSTILWMARSRLYPYRWQTNWIYCAELHEIHKNRSNLSYGSQTIFWKNSLNYIFQTSSMGITYDNSTADSWL